MHRLPILLALLCSPLALAQEAPKPTAPAWEPVVQRVTQAVVALNVTGTRDFDTEGAGSSRGTGFVVDAENGWILTNRHMVHAGPVVAEAVFLNHEEVPLQAIYRDPVHDFGFYRFDPKAVRFMDLVALPLAPENAKVGREIRVIGNDAGEKLSILDGTLSRLDRNAPNYGGNTYNDFNTFYIQAASGTSGGSSGSPVVDVEGKVVALNAGGRRDAASSFYLPLDRVVRAFDLLKAGQPVPRGTLQATWEHTAFDEVRRLGLSADTEAAFRKKDPQGTGLLVLTSTVPEGPAAAGLRPGDVLVRIDGQLVNHFVTLEAWLDDHVGKTVKVEVERGGQPVAVELTVGDLHAITPDRYLEFSRGVVHDLSYHQARNHQVPRGGVYVASAGYSLKLGGIPDDAVIVELDGVPTPDLATFRAELEKKPQGHRMQVRWHAISEPRRSRVGVVPVDRLWNPMQTCVRDDTTGRWPCVASPEPPAATPGPTPEGLSFVDGSKAAKRIAPSLVMVDFDIPHPTAGVKDPSFVGSGLVVDAEKGLVLVDRDTVPVALGDLELTFAGAIRVPGRLVYLHPVHNLALVQYDPAAIGDTPVRSASFLDTPIEEGDQLWQIGLDRKYRLVDQAVKVEDFDTQAFNPASTPRFRDVNVQTVRVADAQPTLGGVLADKKGRVIAQWASFLDQAADERSMRGMPALYIEEMVAQVAAGEAPTYHYLGAELLPISLPDARQRGLPEDAARRLFDHNPREAQVLEVVRLAGGSDARAQLREGDLVVTVNGEVVNKAGEVERALKPWESDRASLEVVRDGALRAVEVKAIPLDGDGADRVVTWAGMILHAPHPEVAFQQGVEAKGVYIAWLWYGSPAARYGIRPTRRITEVNGAAVADLDAFLAAVKGLKPEEPVRLTLVDLDERPSVVTLKLDAAYWPTLTLTRGPEGWARSSW